MDSGLSFDGDETSILSFFHGAINNITSATMLNCRNNMLKFGQLWILAEDLIVEDT